MTNFLHFSSPATLRRLLTIITRNSPIPYVVPDLTLAIKDPRGWIKRLAPLMKKYWVEQLRMNSVAGIQRMWSDHPEWIPINTVQEGLIPGLRSTGIYVGYLVSDFSRYAPKEAEFGEQVNQIKRFGNSYLDPNRVAASRMASHELQSMGITVSETVAYYNRIGARLDTVLRSRDAKDNRRIEFDKMQTAINNITMERGMVNRLGYGSYLIKARGDAISQSVSYDVTKYGLGPCVPPSSIQSRYINILGLPKVKDYDVDSVKKLIESAILIEGISTDVMFALSDAYLKHGYSGLQLMYKAIGLSIKTIDKVNSMYRDLGHDITTMPYSINPRKAYFYSTSPDQMNHANLEYNNKMPKQLQWAIYLAEVFADPGFLSYPLSILPVSIS